MSLPNHVSGAFALAMATTLTSILISTAAQADPNPYAQAPTASPSVTKKVVGGSKVPSKVKVLTPSGKTPGSTAADGGAFVKEGPGFFAKSGASDPGKVTNPGTKIKSPAAKEVRPSAVDTIKKIDEQTGK